MRLRRVCFPLLAFQFFEYGFDIDIPPRAGFRQRMFHSTEKLISKRSRTGIVGYATAMSRTCVSDVMTLM